MLLIIARQVRAVRLVSSHLKSGARSCSVRRCQWDVILNDLHVFDMQEGGFSLIFSWRFEEEAKISVCCVLTQRLHIRFWAFCKQCSEYLDWNRIELFNVEFLECYSFVRFMKLIAFNLTEGIRHVMA